MKSKAITIGVLGLVALGGVAALGKTFWKPSTPVVPPAQAQPARGLPTPPIDGAVVFMDESGFSPRDVQVEQGEQVTFQNRGAASHWPASSIHPTHMIYPAFDPKRGIAAGTSWSFVFDRVGQWKFHDHLNPEFTGSVTVKAKAGDHPQAASSTVVASAIPKALLNAPENPHASLANVNIMLVTQNPVELRSWLRQAGPKRVMQRLLENSGNGSQVDCHQQAHAVGRIAYELYGPAAFRDGTSLCHSGYYHGAMETFLFQQGTANLAADIRKICDEFPTSFENFECLHGVGHGVMAYEDYDLPKALGVCDLLGSTFSAKSCYGGVFMENIVTGQGLGAVKDHNTKWVSQDPLYPCDAISQDYDVQEQCYLMQTSWMLTLFNQDFNKVIPECLRAPGNMIATCFGSTGRDAAGNTLRDPQKISQICDKVPRENGYYARCVVGALNVIVDFWGGDLKTQATDLCKILPEEGKEPCYSTLASRLTAIFASKADMKAVCDGFEENYKKFCSSI